MRKNANASLVTKEVGFLSSISTALASIFHVSSSSSSSHLKSVDYFGIKKLKYEQQDEQFTCYLSSSSPIHSTTWCTWLQIYCSLTEAAITAHKATISSRLRETWRHSSPAKLEEERKLAQFYEGGGALLKLPQLQHNVVSFPMMSSVGLMLSLQDAHAAQLLALLLRHDEIKGLIHQKEGISELLTNVPVAVLLTTFQRLSWAAVHDVVLVRRVALTLEHRLLECSVTQLLGILQSGATFSFAVDVCYFAAYLLSLQRKLDSLPQAIVALEKCLMMNICNKYLLTRLALRGIFTLRSSPAIRSPSQQQGSLTALDGNSGSVFKLEQRLKLCLEELLGLNLFSSFQSRQLAMQFLQKSNNIGTREIESALAKQLFTEMDGVVGRFLLKTVVAKSTSGSGLSKQRLGVIFHLKGGSKPVVHVPLQTRPAEWKTQASRRLFLLVHRGLKTLASGQSDTRDDVTMFWLSSGLWGNDIFEQLCQSGQSILRRRCKDFLSSTLSMAALQRILSALGRNDKIIARCVWRRFFQLCSSSMFSESSHRANSSINVNTSTSLFDGMNLHTDFFNEKFTEEMMTQLAIVVDHLAHAPVPMEVIHALSSSLSCSKNDSTVLRQLRVGDIATFCLKSSPALPPTASLMLFIFQLVQQAGTDQQKMKSSPVLRSDVDLLKTWLQKCPLLESDAALIVHRVERWLVKMQAEKLRQQHRDMAQKLHSNCGATSHVSPRHDHHKDEVPNKTTSPPISYQQACRTLFPASILADLPISNRSIRPTENVTRLLRNYCATAMLPLELCYHQPCLSGDGKVNTQKKPPHRSDLNGRAEPSSLVHSSIPLPYEVTPQTALRMEILSAVTSDIDDDEEGMKGGVGGWGNAISESNSLSTAEERVLIEERYQSCVERPHQRATKLFSSMMDEKGRNERK